ncbi:MAG: 1-acyl-sn-glycerol-3-phosphate acyltransferase [Bdellovibrionales bacterium]|nr:1-acyl-sn-glycerol-3-phosphate acyltransferase [Bdellovibrionales bacterium]
MFYRFLRSLALFLRGHFFSRCSVIGEPPCEDGPVIVVANHPNYFLDPFLLASVFRRELFFLAKSTLFTSITSPLLRAAHLLPVYRMQDGGENRAEKNRQVFASVIEKLEARTGIALFPEGISAGERKLHPIKTGASRMALEAEAQNEFSLGVCIQPIGITYARFGQFRSSVTLSFGRPISVADFREEYHSNQRGAVQALTFSIEQGIREQIVEVDEDRLLAEDIAEIYATKDIGNHDLERFKEIALHLRKAREIPTSERIRIERRIDQFLRLRAQWGLDFDQPLEPPLSQFQALCLTGPYLLGLLVVEPPYWLLRYIFRFQNNEAVAAGTRKLFIGAGVFGLWFGTLFSFLLFLSKSLTLSSSLLLVFILCSIVVSWHGHRVRLFLLGLLRPGGASPVEMLRILRDELINDLECYRSSSLDNS